jgi:trimethylamine:corrinoid methyltransferase-like protein
VIDEATALMDDIMEVGIGGHFLGRRSTRAFARAEVWRPGLFQRGSFAEFEGRPLVAEADARARDLLGSHQPPPLSEDAARHIDHVVAGWTAARDR